MSELSEWFWQERLWFPVGLGWADLEDREGRVYAKARDLWVALPIALLFLIVRQIFERSVCLMESNFPSLSAVNPFFLLSMLFAYFSPSMTALTIHYYICK